MYIMRNKIEILKSITKMNGMVQKVWMIQYRLFNRSVHLNRGYFSKNTWLHHQFCNLLVLEIGLVIFLIFEKVNYVIPISEKLRKNQKSYMLRGTLKSYEQRNYLRRTTSLNRREIVKFLLIGISINSILLKCV